MRGLFVKDLRLMLQRKRFLIIMVAWATVMAYTMEGDFVIGWMSLIFAVMSLSTITYDEYDNCMPFIMSMPVDGKAYVLEKYLFGAVTGVAGWVTAVILQTVVGTVKGDGFRFSPGWIMYLCLCVFILDVSIPVDLKWGSEKGRIVLLVIGGVAFALFYVLSEFLPADVPADISGISGTCVTAGAAAVIAVLTVLSCLISVRIMQNKEF